MCVCVCVRVCDCRVTRSIAFERVRGDRGAPPATAAPSDWQVVPHGKFAYFWNVKTNEVSWTAPPGYR